MKKLIYLISVALITVAATSPETPADTKIIGAWKLLRFQYGKDPIQNKKQNEICIKMFTGTRWSANNFDKATKQNGGIGGGTYTLKGDQYSETVDYYSWDSLWKNF